VEDNELDKLKEAANRVAAAQLKESATRVAMAMVDLGMVVQRQALVLDQFKLEMARLFDTIEQFVNQNPQPKMPKVHMVDTSDCVAGEQVWVFRGGIPTQAEIVDPVSQKIKIGDEFFFSGAVYKEANERHH
jgi:hypothetical protein